MKSSNNFKKFLHNLWYEDPKIIDRASCYDSQGVFSESIYNQLQNNEIEISSENQRIKRLKVLTPIIVIIVALFVIFCLFKVLLCIGLFLGLVGMLLK